MEHDVGGAEERPARDVPLFAPMPEAALQAIGLGPDRRPLLPLVDRVLVELEEHAFALVLDWRGSSSR